MKKQYALLRNNIQIGLYTLKEISKIELLPTDLIWVQAKSVAWLSPDKIDELKQYVKPAAQVLPSEAAQVVYPGVAISTTEGTAKIEVIEDKVIDNNTGFSKVATQGEQPEPLVNETEITSKSEIEESVDHDNDTDSFGVATQGEQPEPVINETEITSKTETEESIQHYNNTNISSEITNMQATPSVNETEVIEATIGQDVETGVSFAATQDEQLNAIDQIEIITKTEVEEVIKDPNINSSKSFAKAYVLLPDPDNGKKEVALRTKANETLDAGKSSVTPYVMKPEILRTTEGRVYVKFPIGVPQSLFYRNEKSIEDKLELKASELSNTKIYAAKPKPRK